MNKVNREAEKVAGNRCFKLWLISDPSALCQHCISPNPLEKHLTEKGNPPGEPPPPVEIWKKAHI